MLKQLEWPFKNAVEAYPGIGFDAKAALDLKPVDGDPDLPLVSSSPIEVDGEDAGSLIVVVLGPNQIIGDESTAGKALPEGHTGATGVLPRLGNTLIHFPLSTHRRQGMACKFVNNLDLVGLSGEGMEKTGSLGLPYLRFLSIVDHGWFAEVQEPEASFTNSPGSNAIHNPHPRLTQASGFFAINSDIALEPVSELVTVPPTLTI